MQRTLRTEDVDQHAAHERRPFTPDRDMTGAEQPRVLVRRRIRHAIAERQHLHHHFLLDRMTILGETDRERDLATNRAKAVQRIRQRDIKPFVDGDIHRHVADRAHQLPHGHGQLVRASREAAANTQVRLVRDHRPHQQRDVRRIVGSVRIEKDHDVRRRLPKTLPYRGALAPSVILDHARARRARARRGVIRRTPIHHEHLVHVARGATHHLGDGVRFVPRRDDRGHACVAILFETERTHAEPLAYLRTSGLYLMRCG